MDYVRISCMSIGSVLLLLWVILYLANCGRYSEYLTALRRREYTFISMYPVGMGILRIFKFNPGSKKHRKLARKVSAIYGEEYSEYFIFCVRGAEVTYGFSFTTLGLVAAGVCGQPLIIFLGIIFGLLFIYDLESQLSKMVDKRKEFILRDFPRVLSKLTLLVNSGMVVREAWSRISETGEGPLYQEMKKTCTDISNGTLEIEAYRRFAERCDIKEVRKFQATMVQNLQKGSKEISAFLRDMSDDMWEEKKHGIKREADKMSQKLLIPVFIIFIGILAMIMVPMFAGMTTAL